MARRCVGYKLSFSCENNCQITCTSQDFFRTFAVKKMRVNKPLPKRPRSTLKCAIKHAKYGHTARRVHLLTPSVVFRTFGAFNRTVIINS